MRDSDGYSSSSARNSSNIFAAGDTRHPVTPSLCHHVTLSPRHSVTLSPRHSVTLSPCHPSMEDGNP